MKINASSLLVPFLCWLGALHPLSAQQQAKKAPKDYAVQVGYNHHVRLPFDNIAVGGPYIELDHSWQLSGYNGGRKGYISVPLGFKSFISPAPDVQNAHILFYGWTVRHELKKGHPRWQPFLGYALLLDQLWIAGRKGNIIGHETRFSFGVDRWIQGRLAYIFCLDYSYTRFPSFDIEKAPKSMSVGLKIGVRF